MREKSIKTNRFVNLKVITGFLREIILLPIPGKKFCSFDIVEIFSC